MNETIALKPKKIKFDNFGYYAIGLIALALLGFWPTYFSKFFDGSADFNFYYHYHFALSSLWIALLIVQPILIKKKKLSFHRQIGKLSFVILPLFLISVIILKHNLIGGEVTEGSGASMWFLFKNLVIISVMFALAMVNKHNMQIHARAMIATGIVFIEPTLGRFIIITLLPESDFMLGFGITFAIICGLIISLIIIERKQTKGRWVFPLLLLFFIVFQCLIFFQVTFPLLDSIANWFVRLPIT